MATPDVPGASDYGYHNGPGCSVCLKSWCEHCTQDPDTIDEGAPEVTPDPRDALVTALTTQLEAERAKWADAALQHANNILAKLDTIADLHARLSAETARADKAEAEAKDAMLANAALREALKEVLSWHDYTDDMHKPVEVRAAYMRARATLAQPADGGK